MAIFPDRIIKDKSIRKGRLNYKLNLEVLFEYFMMYFWALVLIAPVTIPVFIKPANVEHISVLYIGFVVLLDIWMLTNLILLDTLVKLEISHCEIEIQNIKAELEKCYLKLELEYNDQGIIQYLKPSGLFTGWWGKSITLIMDDGTVYINIKSLGRADALSPFHGLSNYLKCKKIAKKF